MSHHKFLNLQPLGKLELDCVCRAISLGVNKDYYEIEKELCLVAELFECEELCVCCYKHLLDHKYNLERIESYQGYKIKDFLELNPKGIYIIRVPQHLTCAIDGIVYDTWDCTNEIIDIIWCVA